jgi:hypothetical protein
MTLSTRLTTFPQPAEVEEYEHAAVELENRLQELPGVIALYRTGNISVPGISDIDRVAVVRNDSLLPVFWKRLQPRTRYLAMHSPFAVDEETFARHRWFASLEPLEIICGREISIAETPNPDESDLLLATESLVVARLKLIKQAMTGRTKVRPFLCELNNVRRDLVLARLEPEDVPAAWDLADEVTRARREWWSLTERDRVDAVRSIQRHAPGAIDEALRAVSLRLGRYPKAEQLELGGPWSNVTLCGNGFPAAKNRYSVVPRVFAGHSGKIAEARWRSLRQSVVVPPAIIGSLNGSLGSASYRRTRRDILRRYRDFIRQRAPTYAALGHAEVFPG